MERYVLLYENMNIEYNCVSIAQYVVYRCREYFKLIIIECMTFFFTPINYILWEYLIMTKMLIIIK